MDRAQRTVHHRTLAASHLNQCAPDFVAIVVVKRNRATSGAGASTNRAMPSDPRVAVFGDNRVQKFNASNREVMPANPRISNTVRDYANGWSQRSWWAISASGLRSFLPLPMESVG